MKTISHHFLNNTFTKEDKLAYFSACVERYLDELPLMRLIIKDNLSENRIYGGFLRWIVETNGRLPLTAFFDGGHDIDIKCENKDVILALFMRVVSEKGYIEYSGSAYDDDDEVNTRTFDEFSIKKDQEIPHGNYMIFIPFNGEWIKYDISYCCNIRSVIDFTVNGLIYPNNIKDPRTTSYKNKKDKREALAEFENLFPQHLVIDDIVQRRLQHLSEPFGVKTFYRTLKLYRLGYRYASPTLMSRIREKIIKESMRDESTFSGKTNVPSIIDGKHSRVRKTKHTCQRLTAEYMSEPEVQAMIESEDRCIESVYSFGPNVLDTYCFMTTEKVEVRKIKPTFSTPNSTSKTVVASKKIQNIANVNQWELIGPRRRHRKVKSPPTQLASVLPAPPTAPAPSAPPTQIAFNQSRKKMLKGLYLVNIDKSNQPKETNSPTLRVNEKVIPVFHTGKGVTENSVIVYKSAFVHKNGVAGEGEGEGGGGDERKGKVIVVLKIPR